MHEFHGWDDSAFAGDRGISACGIDLSYTNSWVSIHMRQKGRKNKHNACKYRSVIHVYTGMHKARQT